MERQKYNHETRTFGLHFCNFEVVLLLLLLLLFMKGQRNRCFKGLLGIIRIVQDIKNRFDTGRIASRLAEIIWIEESKWRNSYNFSKKFQCRVISA